MAIPFARERIADGRREAGRPVRPGISPGAAGSDAGPKDLMGTIGPDIRFQPEENLMKKRVDPPRHSSLALELFQPKPNVLYTLETAAHLAGVPRRSILIYCRAGLVRPVVQAPYGAMVFTEEAIFTVRRIERLRTVRGIDVAWIKTMFDLLDEVELLRAEVRFLRNH